MAGLFTPAKGSHSQMMTSTFSGFADILKILPDTSCLSVGLHDNAASSNGFLAILSFYLFFKKNYPSRSWNLFLLFALTLWKLFSPPSLSSLYFRAVCYTRLLLSSRSFLLPPPKPLWFPSSQTPPLSGRQDHMGGQLFHTNYSSRFTSLPKLSAATQMFP